MQSVKTHSITISLIAKSDKNAIKKIAANNKRSINSEMLLAVEALVAKYKKPDVKDK
jgi:hypothetical protein